MNAGLYLLLNRVGRVTVKAARFAFREPRSTLLILRMGAWVVALSLSVKILSLPRIMQIVTPRVRRARAGDPEMVTRNLARLIDLLLTTEVFVFKPSCWKRATVLYRYLALNGIESRIVFGVRREGEALLTGHAWLEARGVPLLEMNAHAYKATFSFPS